MSLAEQSFSHLLKSLDDRTPTPGGGAATAYAGAVGVALAGMVLRYSIGRKSLVQFEPELTAGVHSLVRSREVILELAEEDQRAFAEMSDLLRRPAEDAQRVRNLPAIALVVMQTPISQAAAFAQVLRLCADLAEKTNPLLRSDLAIAATLCESAARASRWNVVANVSQMESLGLGGPWLEEVDGLLEVCADQMQRILSSCSPA